VRWHERQDNHVITPPGGLKFSVTARLVNCEISDGPKKAAGVLVLGNRALKFGAIPNLGLAGLWLPPLGDLVKTNILLIAGRTFGCEGKMKSLYSIIVYIRRTRHSTRMFKSAVSNSQTHRFQKPGNLQIWITRHVNQSISLKPIISQLAPVRLGHLQVVKHEFGADFTNSARTIRN